MRAERQRRELPGRESLDATGVAQLRDELRQRLLAGGGGISLPPRHEAADRTGSVTVTVDARGRVTDVGLEQRWRSRLGREELAAAVLAAYRMARQRAFEAYTLAVFATEETGSDPPQLTEPSPGTPAGPFRRPPADPDEWLGWISERFAGMREEAVRLAVRPGVHEHSGPHGYFTATVQGSGVVSLAAHENRIWHAETAAVREDALAVLSAADRPTT